MILGIYGAGGLGREMLMLAREINNAKHKWDELIFIDDSTILQTFKGLKILPFSEVKKEYDIKFLEIVIAVGEPSVRNMLRERVETAGFTLATLVHPTVMIDESVKLGAGTIIGANCFISCDITTGENVLVQPNASIGHDNCIGRDSVISTFVCIAGGCNLGEQTYIGLNVPIREGISIGTRSIVGMGSVVVRDIPDGVIAMGNPARAMKENNENKVFK